MSKSLFLGGTEVPVGAVLTSTGTTGYHFSNKRHMLNGYPSFPGLVPCENRVFLPPLQIFNQSTINSVNGVGLTICFRE